MTVEPTVAPLNAVDVETAIRAFILERTKATIAPDDDLFRTGHISSMFAMQLVVHLEETYDIAVIGADLNLDNFRTVEAMTRLVLRLRKADV